jgi:hypothetical protein
MMSQQAGACAVARHPYHTRAAPTCVRLGPLIHGTDVDQQAVAVVAVHALQVRCRACPITPPTPQAVHEHHEVRGRSASLHDVAV